MSQNIPPATLDAIEHLRRENDFLRCKIYTLIFKVLHRIGDKPDTIKVFRLYAQGKGPREIERETAIPKSTVSYKIKLALKETEVDTPSSTGCHPDAADFTKKMEWKMDSRVGGREEEGGVVLDRL